MSDPRDPEGDNSSELPNNIIPFTQTEMAWQFTKAATDDPIFRIDIEKWVRGSTEVVEILEVRGGMDEGVRQLGNVGHGWKYDSQYAGYLRDQEDRVYATLHIMANTYRVDIAGEEKY